MIKIGGSVLCIRVALLAVALMGVSLSSLAQSIYYVRAGATGSNNGSDWNNAYSSLPSSLQRGATYYVADGSYGGYTFNTPASGSTPVTIKKAIPTPTGHGTETGWQTAYGDGQAVFGSIDIKTPYLIVDGQARTETTRLEAPAGYGFKASVLYSSGFAGDNAYGSQFSYIEVGGPWNGSNTPDCNAAETLLYFPLQNNVTFSRCIFHSAQGIGSLHGTTYITMDHCDFYMAWGKATLASPNVQSDHWVIKYCRFWDSSRFNTCPTCHGCGITCEIGCYGNDLNPNDIQIYGCIFYGTSSGGRNACIDFGGSGFANSQAFNCKVFNNTFVGFPEASVLGDIYLYGGSGNEARNNLFYNTGSASVTANSVSGNVRASSNPFVDYNNRDFRLATAIGGGTALSAPYNTDAVGNSRGSDGTWDVGAYEYNSGPDTTPPLVNGLAAVSITTNSAIIAFTTSESARSGVEYGLTTSYGSSATNSTLSINHSLQLNGLTPNTTYHYRVHATDASGNRTTSADSSFQTSQIPAPDTNAPAINGVSVQGITANLATILFSTSESARSGVEYGTTTGYGGSATNATLGTAHSLGVSGLQPNTLYHYRVHATDASGNHAQTADLTFQTVDVDLVSPTVTLTGLGAGSVVSNTVTLSATASDNVGVAGVVFLVDGTSLGAEDTTAPYSLAWDTTGVANGAHSVAARARDAAGNQTTSGVVSITVGNAALPGQFNIGDRVMVNIDPTLRVRSSAALSGAVIGEQPVGVLGIVAAGPVSADGYTWWQINYDNAPDGWSIQGEATSPWLVAVSSAPPAPPQMRTAQVTP